MVWELAFAPPMGAPSFFHWYVKGPAPPAVVEKVTGWPGQRDWINTATWLARVNGARALAEESRLKGSLDELTLALLGRPLPAPERARLEQSGAGRTDQVRALLCLPEAHLA